MHKPATDMLFIVIFSLQRVIKEAHDTDDELTETRYFVIRNCLVSTIHVRVYTIYLSVYLSKGAEMAVVLVVLSYRRMILPTRRQRKQ